MRSRSEHRNCWHGDCSPSMLVHKGYRYEHRGDNLVTSHVQSSPATAAASAGLLPASSESPQQRFADVLPLRRSRAGDAKVREPGVTRQTASRDQADAGASLAIGVKDRTPAIADRPARRPVWSGLHPILRRPRW
jgi:hypothetical protein